MSGYQPCGCHDCMDITVGDGTPTLCAECEAAGCVAHGDRPGFPAGREECQRADAYGFDPSEYDSDKYYGT